VRHYGRCYLWSLLYRRLYRESFGLRYDDSLRSLLFRSVAVPHTQSRFTRADEQTTTVPVDTTTIKTLYVFVEISVDRPHLAASVLLNFPHCIPPRSSTTLSNSALAKGKGPELEIAIEPSSIPSPSPAQTEEKEAKTTKLAVVGTIQFVAAVQGLKADMETEEASHVERLAIEGPKADGEESVAVEDQKKRKREKFEIIVPQVKPLSPGEILGCTAPKLANDVDALLYVSTSQSSRSLVAG